MNFEIRTERVEDAQTIRQVTEAAFKVARYASGTEGAIIDALRAAGALSVSLVAIVDNEIVGHVAFSPVSIEGQDLGWFGLGPVSVRPDLQGKGVGSALIREGLAQLQKTGAAGCVLLGEPTFYKRFGFENDPALRYENAPPEYFMRLSFMQPTPAGKIAYHHGFSTS